MRRCSESGILHQGCEVHDYRSRKRGVKVPYTAPASDTSAVPHLHCLRAQRRAPYNNLVFFSAFWTPSTTPRGTVAGSTISLRSSFQFSPASSLCASNTCLVLPQPTAFASPTPTVGRLAAASGLLTSLSGLSLPTTPAFGAQVFSRAFLRVRDRGLISSRSTFELAC